MKVVLAAPYLYLDEISCFTRNKSGLAYMISSIAQEIGKTHELSVITQSYFIKHGRNVRSFFLIKKSILDILFHFKPLYLFSALSYIIKSKPNIKHIPHILLYYATGSYFEFYLEKHSPDLVHVHTLSNYTIPFIMACERSNTNYCVTLHGIISLDRQYITASESEFQMEEDFIIYANKNNIPISMIATGMKKRMERHLGIDLDNVTIINNFCGDDITNPLIDSSFYHRDRTFLCIGSVYRLKNQRQVIDAFKKIKEEFVNAQLKIIGDGVDLDMLKQYVYQNDIKGVVFTGRISHDQLSREYDKASAVIMASMCEGFGLPVLEGYCHGTPSVMFSNLDAFEDLYDEKVMVPVYERSDESLINAMRKVLLSKWDREYILEFAKRFNKITIGKKYSDWISKQN